MLRHTLIAAILLLAAPAAFTSEAAACSVDLEGNDLLQYNRKSIEIPGGCTEFTIHLRHSGKQPKTVMGHNVVIAKTSDIGAIDAAGLKSGLESDYIKAGDARVIAHTRVLGGGESASLTFPVAKLAGPGPFSFFCSFPGHSALMRGTIRMKQ
jgi:azurin